MRIERNDRANAISETLPDDQIRCALHTVALHEVLRDSMTFNFKTECPQPVGGKPGVRRAVTGRIVRRDADEILKERHLTQIEIPVDDMTQTFARRFLTTGSLFKHSAFSHRIA